MKRKSHKPKHKGSRVMALFNTGQQIHRPGKGKGSYVRNKGSLNRSLIRGERPFLYVIKPT
jgi:hypothetical protein